MSGPGLRITDLDKSISIEKPVGKPLELKPGETVKAEVVSVSADGEVSLKIKGIFITAKTEVLLIKDSMVLFKVLGAWGSDTTGKDLRLQFKGLADEPGVGTAQTSAKLVQAKTVENLLHDLSKALGDKTLRDFPPLAEKLMKALPAEAESLPKELRVQLQDFLKSTLSVTGQDRAGRIESMIQELQTQVKAGSIPESLTKNLMVSIKDLTPQTLKSALENTGVALEAKLKTILVDQVSQQAGEDRLPVLETLGRESAKASLQVSEKAGQAGPAGQVEPAKSDLKAGLIQLKALLMDKGEKILEEALAEKSVLAKSVPSDSPPAKQLLQAADGLLRDINTFQLLSKTTDSFHTFLPVLWSEMREGDIAFKRARTPAGGGKSYYCMMNLDFETLGSLAIMVMMQDQEFFVSFKAGGASLKSILEEHSPELHQIFEENGLKLKSVNVLGSEDTSLAPFERLENLESVLNIRV